MCGVLLCVVWYRCYSLRAVFVFLCLSVRLFIFCGGLADSGEWLLFLFAIVAGVCWRGWCAVGCFMCGVCLCVAPRGVSGEPCDALHLTALSVC